jgi:hypothetical protein
MNRERLIKERARHNAGNPEDWDTNKSMQEYFISAATDDVDWFLSALRQGVPEGLLLTPEKVRKLMICEKASECLFDCETKKPHEYNKHPEYYGDCDSQCEGDALGTFAGAKCIPYVPVPSSVAKEEKQ